MSRGNRDAVSGNIKLSMRDNYAEHGVDDYYKKVGATYRNPHFPGVRACIFLWLNKWWQEEQERIGLDRVCVFDMACGSGEATVAFMEWWKQGKASAYSPTRSTVSIPRKKSPIPDPPSLSSELPTPQILAADPFTAEAFKTRTTLNCSTWSFQQIADGALADLLIVSASSSGSTLDKGGREEIQDQRLVEMTICSFALHLIESPSELFALLWELSSKSRWLIVLAPHKRPEIKPGWGWMKWDVGSWTERPMSQSNGEFLQDRVHCRVYRSANIP